MIRDKSSRAPPHRFGHRRSPKRSDPSTFPDMIGADPCSICGGPKHCATLSHFPSALLTSSVTCRFFVAPVRKSRAPRRKELFRRRKLFFSRRKEHFDTRKRHSRPEKELFEPRKGDFSIRKELLHPEKSEFAFEKSYPNTRKLRESSGESRATHRK